MASWAVTQRTHGSYVQITDPATPPAERARLPVASGSGSGGECQGTARLHGDRGLQAGAAVSEIQHYVIVAGPGGRASGLTRRRYADSGPVDETLHQDLSWQPDSAIVECRNTGT